MLIRQPRTRRRTRARPRLLSCVAVACAVTMAATACSTDSGDNARDCIEGDPSCTVLWGVAVPGGSAAAVQRLEDSMDEKFDFVYSYHDINDVIPSSADKKIIASGHFLHISIVPRDFALKDKNTIRWRDVANGRYDSTLMKQARGIANLRIPVYLTFDHEPDQASKVARGTPQDYIAAWRHLYGLYQRAQAKNVTWVWVMMGWQPSLGRAGRLWPGNKYVDWISWEAYNHAGCFEGAPGSGKEESFESGIATAYNWLHRDGTKYGIDPDKPMMISEAGTILYRGDPERTAKWYAAIPQVLHQYPQIRAIALFDDRLLDCDYEFQKQPAALTAVRHAIRTSRGQ